MAATTHPSVALRRVSPGRDQWFFGYYDKCPWDAAQRYLLALRTATGPGSLRGDEWAEVMLVDLADGGRATELGRTRAWCWQQGNMLQWLGDGSSGDILYNRLDGDRFVTVLRNVRSGRERILDRATYCVDAEGRQALGLTFARLAWTRPGYGYPALPDPHADELAPADDGIYHLDLNSGASRLIISLADVAAAAPQPEAHRPGAVHWFNHLTFNPSGSRFVFLHRFLLANRRWFTRVLTANADGSDLFVLHELGYASHFAWRDDRHILFHAEHPTRGRVYVMFTDRSDEALAIGDDVLTCDGHCSFAPDGCWMLTDTYPDKERMRTLMAYRMPAGPRVDLGRFLSPAGHDSDYRCDLHPRWSRDGGQVCIDSAHEGLRQLYVLDVAAALRP